MTLAPRGGFGAGGAWEGQRETQKPQREETGRMHEGGGGARGVWQMSSLAQEGPGLDPGRRDAGQHPPDCLLGQAMGECLGWLWGSRDAVKCRPGPEGCCALPFAVGSELGGSTGFRRLGPQTGQQKHTGQEGTQGSGPESWPRAGGSRSGSENVRPLLDLGPSHTATYLPGCSPEGTVQEIQMHLDAHRCKRGKIMCGV